MGKSKPSSLDWIRASEGELTGLEDHFKAGRREGVVSGVLAPSEKPNIEILKLAEHQEPSERQRLSFLADLCINKLAPSEVSDDEVQNDANGKTKIDEDLSKPFKEVLKCPFTRRIIEFSSPSHRMSANVKIYDGTGDPEDHIGRFVGIGSQGEWPMPVWCRMFQQTLNGKARAWFDKLPSGNIDNWGSLQEKFLNIFRMLKLMQISSFMSSHKCPELAKRFSDSIPKTVDDMLKRVDDYLRSEEAFRSTELPRGSSNYETHQCSRYNETTEANGFPMGIIVAARDLSEEALVVEAEVEGYLVRMIHIDEGASIEIMFEHYFNMLHPSIRTPCLKIAQGNSFYHSRNDDIPNPWGVATVVSQTPVVLECRSKRKKQAV
ncbi:hypothetical protein Tco_1117042 [Tanacetum coccineum]